MPLNWVKNYTPQIPFLGYSLENNRNNRLQGGGLTKQCKYRVCNVNNFLFQGGKARPGGKMNIYSSKDKKERK